MSERAFSSTMETALAAAEAPLGFLVYLDWPSSAVRVWTGVGDVTWNAQTWAGAGEIASIDKIADSVEKADIGVELVLNYLDDDLRNEVTTQQPVGRDASIYLALLNPATRAVTDAYEIFTGFVDRIEILDAGSTGQITVRLASELARLQRPRYFTLSHAHQQFLFSGDLGCEFASHMTEPIYWGRKAPILMTPGMQSVAPYPMPYPGYSDQFVF